MNIADIVKTQPGITVIPEDTIRLGNVNYDVFEEGTQDIVEVIAGFINAPYITDKFQDHKERRAWRDTMEQQHGPDMKKYLDNNALRQNLIGMNCNLMLTLPDQYTGENDRFEEEVDKIRVPLGFVHSGGYAALETDRKVEYAKSIKREMVRIFSKA